MSVFHWLAYLLALNLSLPNVSEDSTLTRPVVYAPRYRPMYWIFILT